MRVPIIILFCLLLCVLQTFGKTYSEVIEVPNVTKNQLYQRALSFFNNSFVSSKEVIQNSDKEEGKIFGRGTYEYMKINTISYTVEIAVKDGRYKYTISNFRHTGYTDGGVRNGGNLANEKPECGYIRMTKGYWNKIKTHTDTKTRQLIGNMKAYMHGEIEGSSDNDDW